MKLKHKTIFVTGGAGFIGSNFVEAVAKDNRVIVYDNFSSSVVTVSNLSHLSNLGYLKTIKGDILDQKKLEKSMKGADIVFHFAVACVRLSLSQEQYVHDVNTTGTLTTLLAARASDASRFIYISSSEAYGSAQGKVMDENHEMHPTTVFGMSKYMGELYTRQFNDTFGLPGMVIRPFNTYGPRCHFEDVYGEVIPRMVIRALNGKQPIIFGTGKQTRDFTYVTDTVKGIIEASESDALLGTCTNIAYGQEISIARIATLICKEVGLPYKPIMKPERPNDVARHAANITKAQETLHYTPTINIEEGIKKYIAWVKEAYPHPEKLLHYVPDKNY